MQRRYDADWNETTTLKDGTSVELRLIRPGDKPLFVDGLERMSAESRFFRFFAHRGALSAGELRYLTELDHESHVAIGAVTLRGIHEVGLGVARFIRLTNPQIAEAAITVIDDAQGKGLGRVLFEHLVASARERGIELFRFDVLAENESMLKLVEAIFPGSSSSIEDGIVTIDCPLPNLQEPAGDDAPLYRVLRMAAEGALRVYRGLRDNNKLLKGSGVPEDFGVDADDTPAPAREA